MTLSAADITDLIRQGVPLAGETGFFVERIDESGRTWCRQPYRANQLRPGGTLSGPSMMALADAAMYAAVLHRLGRVEMALTQTFHINFLSRPAPRDLLAAVEIVKMGRRSAVLEARLYSDSDGVPGADSLVAHATGTYSLPPRA